MRSTNPSKFFQANSKAGLAAFAAVAIAGCGAEPSAPVEVHSSAIFGLDELSIQMDYSMQNKFSPPDLTVQDAEELNPTYPGMAPTYEDIHPEGLQGWQISLDACGSRLANYEPIVSYEWVVTPARLPEEPTNSLYYRPTLEVSSEDCRIKPIILTHLDDVTATLTLVGANGTRKSKSTEFFPRDILIVSMGDSVASGEGLPDVPSLPDPLPFGASAPLDPVWDSFHPSQGFLTPPAWRDWRCHRSALSGHALAARQIEERDPHSVVTFISTACSGAKIREGLLLAEPYGRDCRVGQCGQAIPPQLEEVEDLICPVQNQPCNGPDDLRPIDALFVTIGANDMGFGDLSAELAHPLATTEDLHWPLDWFFIDNAGSDIPPPEVLAANYDSLNAEISSRLPVEDADVFLTDYPNILSSDRGEDNELCHEIRFKNALTHKSDFEWGQLALAVLFPNPGVAALFADDDAVIPKESVKFAFDNFSIPLTHTIHEKVVQHGWTLVPLSAAFPRNGYCARAENRMVRTYFESRTFQGDDYGTLHPNGRGHQVMSEFIVSTYDQRQASKPPVRVMQPVDPGPPPPVQPGCSFATAYCSTGHVMEGVTQVSGRGTTEGNGSPNTIDGCLDGDGTSSNGFDMSIEHVILRGDNHRNFEVNRPIEIEVATNVSGTATSAGPVHLDVFHSATTESPDWQLIDTVNFNSNDLGLTFRSFQFVLPEGEEQAIRVQLRVQSTVPEEILACEDGIFNDRDDLYFVVQPSTVLPEPVALDCSVSSDPCTAKFESGLGAPVCGDPGVPSCSSGTELRGRYSSEDNSPNTLDGCVDGVGATRETDIRSLAIRTLDGKPLAPGKLVHIDVEVTDTGLHDQDYLQIFHAPDASSPVWTELIPTAFMVADPGDQTVTFEVTLPESSTSLSAIRAKFAYLDGSNNPCSTVVYHDNDDLAFATLGQCQPGDPCWQTSRVKATVDPDYGAPRCSEMSSLCTTGRVDEDPLVAAAATSEFSSPGSNTIDGCQDGASGGHQIGASVEHLLVHSLDGTVLEDGDEARIEVGVWVPANPGWKAILTLYHAPNAERPQWTQFGFDFPPQGYSTVSRKIPALPPGRNQAFRAQLSFVPPPNPYNNYPSGPCDAGAMHDRDDLVVRVDADPSMAIFDEDLGVPACHINVGRCSTGIMGGVDPSEMMIAGRGSDVYGNEYPENLRGRGHNFSHTLDGCVDGWYYQQQAIQHMVVQASNGEFYPGENAELEVGFMSRQNRYVDLYYASDASDPQWTWFHTEAVTEAGTYVVRHSFTVPNGPQPAVRAQIRRHGGAQGGQYGQACRWGYNNDRDDVVFSID